MILNVTMIPRFLEAVPDISFHLSKPRFLRRDERVEEKRAWIENCDNDIDVIGDWV